jgi:hypothetical protein
MKFKYGQVVKCIAVPDGEYSLLGKTGIIREFTGDEDEPWYGVEFEDWNEGHYLEDDETGQILEVDSGWDCPEPTLAASFEVINIEEII